MERDSAAPYPSYERAMERAQAGVAVRRTSSMGAWCDPTRLRWPA
jgi:hypothetical protein